ncbi:MAG: PqqD family protein [Armatimonadota bacterium]
MLFTVKTNRIIHETFDDEVVIVNLDSGSYYSLNTVGSDIWSLIEAGSTLAEMTAHILSRYSGDHSEVQPAIQTFLQNLLAESLVTSSPEETPGTEAPIPASPSAPSGLPPFAAPQISKYTDMQELLLMDVIHDVDETGWPNAVEKVAVESQAH